MNNTKGFEETIEWYNKNAKEFAQKAGSSSYQVNDEFIKLLPSGAKLLDSGCGSGQDTYAFAQKGFKPIGVDLSSGLIEEAKRSYPNCEFSIEDMRKMSFSNEVFDGVWASASLLHFETIEDVKKCLKEFYRVLKAHGILFVGVKLQTGKTKTGLENDKRFLTPRFFQYFTTVEMKQLFKEAGFEVKLITIE